MPDEGMCSVDKCLNEGKHQIASAARLPGTPKVEQLLCDEHEHLFATETGSVRIPA